MRNRGKLGRAFVAALLGTTLATALTVAPAHAEGEVTPPPDAVTYVAVDTDTTQAQLDADGVNFDLSAVQDEVVVPQCSGGGGTLSTTKDTVGVNIAEPPPVVDCPDGSSCSLVCGVVHNRTGASLYLSRDSTSSLYCAAAGPYRYLPNGSNSNTYLGWPDTDCFAGTYGSGWVYYRGLWHPPYDWVRIQTHVWIY